VVLFATAHSFKLRAGKVQESMLSDTADIGLKAENAKLKAQIAALKSDLAAFKAQETSAFDEGLKRRDMKLVLLNGAEGAIGSDGMCRSNQVQRDAIVSLSSVFEKKQVCQIECADKGCDNAFAECESIEGCTGISLNAEQTWGTLKFAFNWWKPTDVEYAGTNWEVCQETFRKMQGLRSKRGNKCRVCQETLPDVTQGWHDNYCADLVHGEYAPKM
jgi:hypothetical protein